MAKRGGEGGRERSERVDKKHRFPLRIDQDIHYQADAITFRYRLSLNFLYTEAIQYALQDPNFMTSLQLKYGRRVNPKRGHFTYFQNNQ